MPTGTPIETKYVEYCILKEIQQGKYRIEINFGLHGLTIYGGIIKATYHFFKTINSGAYIKITKLSKI